VELGAPVAEQATTRFTSQWPLRPASRRFVWLPCVRARAPAGWTADAPGAARCIRQPLRRAGADEVQVAGMQDGCAASYSTVTGDGDGEPSAHQGGNMRSAPRTDHRCRLL